MDAAYFDAEKVMAVVRAGSDQFITELNKIPLDVLKVWYVWHFTLTCDTPELENMRKFQMAILAAYIEAKEFANVWVTEQSKKN